MLSVEIKLISNEKTVYFGTHHDLREAKGIVIDTCGRAGWLNFKKERGGDIRATNNKYIVDIMY